MNQNIEGVIEYYDSLELILQNARAWGEYRTHFGILDAVSDHYCWMKGTCEPFTCTDIARTVQDGMIQLHSKIFNEFAGSSQKKFLDVGCGCGSTMQQLAQDLPNCEIYGINLNENQVNIARKAVCNSDNITIYYDDVLVNEFNDDFDVIYFIESAFHIKNKIALMKKVNQILKPGGIVLIIEVFCDDRKRKFIERLSTSSTLFDYQSIGSWAELFAPFKIHFSSFTDCSQQVANYLRIQWSRAEYISWCLKNPLKGIESQTVFLENMLLIYDGYVQLQRLLKKQWMQYGILKFVKQDE